MLLILGLMYWHGTLIAATWYSQSSGSWGLTGTPQLWNTQPDGSGTFMDGTSLLNATDDVVIQTGHEVEITGFLGFEYIVNNLKILVDGKLYTTSNPQGSIFQINGVSASVNGDLDLSHTTLKLSTGVNQLFGDGTITALALQINPITTLSLAIDIRILGDFEPAYVAGLQSLQAVTVAVGKTLRIDGDLLVDPDFNLNPLASSTIDVRGNLTVEGRVEVYGNLDLRSNDTPGMIYIIAINTGGTITLMNSTSQIVGTGTSFLSNAESYLDVSGTLETKATDMFTDASIRSIVRMLTGSSCILSGTGNQALDADVQNATYYDVELTNPSGVISLEGTTTVENELTLTSNSLALGNFDLTMSKLLANGYFFGEETIKGYDATKYIQTNGTGKLFQFLTGNGFVPAVYFPVGNASFNPALLINEFIMGNSPTSDFFSLRVADQVLADGTTGAPITTGYVNRTWYLDELVAGGQSVNFQIFWNASDELPGFTRLDCNLTHYTMGAWDFDLSSGTASGSGPYNRTRPSINSFSPFSIRNAAPLPVELVDFKGAWSTDGTVLLTWETQSEIDNDFFEIQYSTDGLNFSRVSRVKGRGNSTQLQQYQSTHLPIDGIQHHYYRLKQVDYDGQSSYSPIITLSEQGPIESKEVNIFPSIVEGQLFVKGLTAKTRPNAIYAVSMDGKRIPLSIGSDPDQEMIALNVESLGNGAYFLVVVGNTGAQLAKQYFIKQ